MNTEPQPDPQQSEPDTPRNPYSRPAKKRNFWILGVIGLLAWGGIVQSYRWFTTPRASAERLIIQSALRSVGQAAAIYKSDFGVLPAPPALLVQSGLLTVDQMRSFSSVQYNADAKPHDPALIVVQTEPCRAVAKGEPWGGPGEFTDRDLPAVRFALFADLRVKPIPEDEFQAHYAPSITLKPMQ